MKVKESETVGEVLYRLHLFEAIGARLLTDTHQLLQTVSKSIGSCRLSGPFWQTQYLNNKHSVTNNKMAILLQN